MRLSVDTCPAGAAVFWLLLGVLAVYVPAQCDWPAVPTLAGLALAGLLFWRASEGNGRRYAWFLPAGAGLTVLHLLAPWQTVVPLLPRTECGGELQAVVTDPLFSPEEVPALALPASVKIAACAVRFAPDQPWRPCRGALLLRLTGDEKPCLAYGSHLRLRGAFLVPEEPLFPGDFDYRRYLRTLGIRHLFLADTVTVDAPCQGWRRLPGLCYRARDRLMALMAAHLRDSRDVQVLSALLFGYQAAVAPDLREAFLRSGTIHVLSVSGLHVVILGSIFVLLLRLCGVPFRWRYALLPFLVGVYVLMAGNAPAAQRAWLMISLWAAGQALLRPVNSLNSVATAGLILLCLNPLCVGQTGVQFSFVLVVALVGGWRVAQPLRAVLCERNLWIPRRCRTSFWHTTLFPHAVDLATGSMIGWLASAGLIAWVNGRFIPSALIVNFGIGAGAWLVLFLASVKLIFGFLLQGFWNGLDVVLARSLETVLHLIGLFAEWGSLRPGSLPVPRPELAVVLLFYAALAVALLVPGPWRWRPLALLSVCGSLAAMVLAPRPVNHAAVFSGDGAAAPVVVLCGDRVSPVILNSGPRRLTLAVEQWLTGHGFDRAEALVLPAAGFAESAKRLTESVAPRTLLLPPRETAGLAAVRGLQETLGGRVRHLQAAVGSPPATEAAGWSHVAVQVVRDREVVRVEVTLAGTGSALALSAEQQPDRGTRLRLRRDGATSACRFAPLALRPRLVEISL